MSLKAWTFICSVIIGGFVLTFLAIPSSPIPLQEWQTFGLLLLLAVTTQLIESQFGKSTYYPHTAFFFAGVILLRPVHFILLIIISHLAEWLQKRLSNSPYLRDWYLQPFNISVHISAGISAQIALRASGHWITGASSGHELLGVLLGAIVYVLINHLMVGQALVLARGLAWKKSGVLSAENIVTELILLVQGYVAAHLWQHQMWLLIPALAPLFLVYKAMTVPKLRREARTDLKTGLYNSRYFNDKFHEEFHRAQRFERPISLVVADLDLLRDINNSHGHLAGDSVITGIAQIFQQQVRDYDICGRFGGEEFAIVLPEADEETAWQIAERLRQAIENSEFCVPSQTEPIRATMSFGIASFPQAAPSPKALFHEADMALYQAKFQGRNRAVRSSEIPLTTRFDFVECQQKPSLADPFHSNLESAEMSAVAAFMHGYSIAMSTGSELTSLGQASGLIEPVPLPIGDESGS